MLTIRLSHRAAQRVHWIDSFHGNQQCRRHNDMDEDTQ